MRRFRLWLWPSADDCTAMAESDCLYRGPPWPRLSLISPVPSPCCAQVRSQISCPPLGVDILLELLAEATQLLNKCRSKPKHPTKSPVSWHYPGLHLPEDGCHGIIGASQMTGRLGPLDLMGAQLKKHNRHRSCRNNEGRSQSRKPTNSDNITCMLRRTPRRNPKAVLPCLRLIAPGQAACQNTSPLPDGSICVGKFEIPGRHCGAWCMTSSMLVRSLGSCISGASSCFCLGDLVARRKNTLLP